MTTLPDPYASLDLGAEKFQPEQPGTQIELVVADIRQVTTKDGLKNGALVTGVDDDGTDFEWIAWNLRNKAELRREKPMPGDKLRIEYLGRDPDASNPALAARWFKLTKLSPSGQTDQIPF